MDHHLNLMLFSAAVANDADFDLKRRVFEDVEPGFASEQQRDSANVRKLQRGFRIYCMKDFFDGERVRFEFSENAPQFRRDAMEPLFERVSRTGTDHACGNEPVAAAIRLDDAIPRPLRSAVYADDSHFEQRHGARAGPEQFKPGLLLRQLRFRSCRTHFEHRRALRARRTASAWPEHFCLRA